MKVNLALSLVLSVSTVQALYAADASDCATVNREEWHRFAETPDEAANALRTARPETQKTIKDATSIIWYGNKTGSLKSCIPGDAYRNCGEQVFTFRKSGMVWGEERLSEVIVCT